MEIANVHTLLDLFRGLSWSWSLGSWRNLAARLGLELQEDVGDRLTYAFPGGPDLDVYLSSGQIDSVEATVDAFLQSEELDEIAYEDKVDEYYEKFRESVALATQVLGDPVFCDGSGAADFPDDQDAVWLALWPGENARFMVQQKHEDRELPFRICVVVAPGP